MPSVWMQQVLTIPYANSHGVEFIRINPNMKLPRQWNLEGNCRFWPWAEMGKRGMFVIPQMRGIGRTGVCPCDAVANDLFLPKTALG